MKRVHWATAAAAVVAMCAAGLSTGPHRPARGAAPPGAGAGPGAALVVRIYDVSDLVRPPIDQPFESAVIPPSMLFRRSLPGGGGGGGSGLFSPNADNKDAKRPEGITVDGIVSLLTSLVDAETWGPDGGSVVVAQNLLVVRQSDATHKRLAALLGDLRAARADGKPLDVQAFWVLVPPADLKGILKGNDKAAGREVDLAAVEKLGDRALYARAAVACLSGRPSYVLSGRARSVMIDQNASVGTAVAAYDPEVEQVLAGVALRIVPHLEGDGVVVDVLAAVGDWHEPPKPAHLGGQQSVFVPATQPSDLNISSKIDMSADVDRLNMTASHLATTARVPLGRPVLVGGMTLEPAAGAEGKADAPAAGDARQLYLVLLATSPEPPAGGAKAGKEVGR